MFITKKHLSRRTVLRGVGVSLALPLLDSMLPAQTPLAKTAAAVKPRFTGIFMPHGAAGCSAEGMEKGYWSPAKEGADFEFTQSLASLEPYRKYITVVSDTDHKLGAAQAPSEEGADHTRAASVFLTGVHVKQTEGSDIQAATSMDQLYANQFGQDTPLPSIQLCIENVGSLTGACGYGYSCVYANTMTWNSPTTPLPHEIDPRVAFERLFGDGATAQIRVDRRKADRSVLDSINSRISKLQSNLAPGDRKRLDEYLTDVREIERRIQKVEAYNSSGAARSLPEAPIGVPDTFDEHVKLMYYLQALAFMSETTRVSTFMMGRDVSARVYPESGVKVPFHACSHHGENSERIAQYSKLNEYHVKMVAYYIKKLYETKEGDGNLLDSTVVLYGSCFGDGNIHEHNRLPLFMAGLGNGALKGNLHYRAPRKTPMANAMLTVLQGLGVKVDKFGDSTGTMPLA